MHTHTYTRIHTMPQTIRKNINELIQKRKQYTQRRRARERKGEREREQADKAISEQAALNLYHLLWESHWNHVCIHASAYKWDKQRSRYLLRWLWVTLDDVSHGMTGTKIICSHAHTHWLTCALTTNKTQRISTNWMNEKECCCIRFVVGEQMLWLFVVASTDKWRLLLVAADTDTSCVYGSVVIRF